MSQRKTPSGGRRAGSTTATAGTRCPAGRRAAPPAGGRASLEGAEGRSLVWRITDLTGSALRRAAKTTETSLKLGKELLLSPDKKRILEETGHSLRDLRTVAGLTLNEVSEALDMRDRSFLEAVEDGTATLSFELILRLSSLLARHDPVPFIIKYTRTYDPDVWRFLEDWGVGRLPLQYERERKFVNIYRRKDAVRSLSDEEWQPGRTEVRAPNRGRREDRPPRDAASRTGRRCAGRRRPFLLILLAAFLPDGGHPFPVAFPGRQTLPACRAAGRIRGGAP